MLRAELQKSSVAALIYLTCKWLWLAPGEKEDDTLRPLLLQRKIARPWPGVTPKDDGSENYEV